MQKEIFAKEEDDDIAHDLIHSFYEDLSVGILNLISCFDPELVLIGGGISAKHVIFRAIELHHFKNDRKTSKVFII